MKQEFELIGCPWCGKCPIITHMKDIIYTIGCNDFKCHIKPNVISNNLESAIKSWNARINPKDELKYTITINLKGRGK